MGLHVAAVVFPTWQAVVLILLCFGSLIIALYCLFFMVPLKSFVERIDSLGGGMKGMESHVDGLKNETDRRVASLEERICESLRELRCELQQSIDTAADKTTRALDGLQRLDKATHNLQAEIRDAASDTRKLGASLDAVRAGLDDLRSDFTALEGELRGSVNQQVSDSYQKLESTVLSALEAVQDDMLRGASKLRAWQSPTPPSRPAPNGKLGTRGLKDSRRKATSKIISAEPLFADAEKGQGDAESDKDDADALKTEKQEAPAK